MECAIQQRDSQSAAYLIVPPAVSPPPPAGMRIEPENLVRCFLAHPPVGFATSGTANGIASFETNFDLLTTLNPQLRRRLVHWPLYSTWRHWLAPRVSFVGTTVTEYAQLPTNVDAFALISDLLAQRSQRQRLLIIKDLPTASPLLGSDANNYAEAVKCACRASEFTIIAGQALAYVPLDFTNIADYLARRTTSRRKDLRRKLRARQQLEIAALPTGSDSFDDPAVIAEYYALYLNVFEQSELHFDMHTETFFRAVLTDALAGGIVFTYRHRGQLIGFNLCYVYGDKLVDKLIGLRYPAARDLNLYFVSWMRNLEYALAAGLKYYVAGWTDPQVKKDLGARFTWTEHAVYARNPLLRGTLRLLRRHFESDANWQREHADASAIGA